MKSLLRVMLGCSLMFTLNGCGRTEPDAPEDVPDAPIADGADALDGSDRPDVPDAPDVLCTSNAECDNGVFCDGIEQCLGGRCQPGNAVVCADRIGCTVDSCDEGLRACAFRPNDMLCPTGERCDMNAGCVATGCRSNTDCDDGNVCNGVELCAAGRCVSSPPPRCDDGIACTEDRCIPTIGCLSRPNNALCNDGRFCNGEERCDMTVRGCVPAPPACEDGNDCTVDLCDEASRTCRRSALDADGDGFPASRCGGRDCDDGNPRINPGAAELCADRRDNDCNGLTDCADLMCRTDPSCGSCVPTGPENSVAACADGRDNDCDRQIDCLDPECSGIGMCGCVAFPEVCNDLRDNDCDRLVDCADPDCAASPLCVVCVPTGPENNAAACGDARDNDCDRLTDCADPDCAAVPACVICMPTGPENTDATCTDRRDNDCDRLVDCADPGCATVPACVICTPSPENTIAACGDGRDNDCDRLVDCADPECATMPMCVICMPTGPENTDATCFDGRDNDCDMAVDCADPGCAATSVCRPPPPNDTCSAPIRVGVPSTTTGSSSGARNDFTPTTAGFPGCAGGAGPDVVYTFTLTATTPLTIDVTALTGWDPVVYVRRDNCLMGAQSACNDDTFGLNSRVAFTAAPGTYYVFVDGYGTMSQGTFELRITLGLPAEVCNNFRDDDGDTLVDCADPDCRTDPRCSMCMPTGPEGSAATCMNGRDDDCDGSTDCADPGCGAFCCVPTGPENSAATCSDARDNNCNGLTDCTDPGCSSLPVCCRITDPENTPAACADGRDNNCNGLTDCADPSCASAPGCCLPSPEVCNDGRDNDCDRLVDCADPSCTGSPLCGCVPTGTRERGVAQCTDGRDNDCDGVRDCADSDCQPFAGGECCNGRDDNMNTIIDEFACNCGTNMDCVGVGVGGRFPSNTCYASTFGICGPRCDMLGGDFFCGMIFAGSTCDRLTGECRR